VEGPAVPSIATDLNSIASNSNLPSSRLERAAVARVVEGPASTGAPAARRLSPENATTLSAPSLCHAEEHSDEASLSQARTNINSSIAVHVAPSDPGRSLNRIEPPALCHAEERSDEASLSTAPAQCHPERSAKRGAEGSFVSSPEAAAVSVSAIPWTSSALPPTPCHPKQKALRLRA
jgi:hypothetical protein